MVSSGAFRKLFISKSASESKAYVIAVSVSLCFTKLIGLLMSQSQLITIAEKFTVCGRRSPKKRPFLFLERKLLKNTFNLNLLFYFFLQDPSSPQLQALAKSKKYLWRALSFPSPC